MENQEKIKHIVDTIAQNVQPEKIILFGSHARDDASENSDIDLLIVKESALPRYKRSRSVRKYIRGAKIPIDLIDYTPDEIEKYKNIKSAFITQVMNQGQILYDRKSQSR